MTTTSPSDPAVYRRPFVWAAPRYHWLVSMYTTREERHYHTAARLARWHASSHTKAMAYVTYLLDLWAPRAGLEVWLDGPDGACEIWVGTEHGWVHSHAEAAE